jgi:hypothetical protein
MTRSGKDLTLCKDYVVHGGSFTFLPKRRNLSKAKPTLTGTGINKKMPIGDRSAFFAYHPAVIYSAW